MFSTYTKFPKVTALLCAGGLTWSAGLGAVAAEPPQANVTQFLKLSVAATKGLQRSKPFLDLSVLESKSRLQVAFVLDGTDSSAPELDDLRRNLGGFVRGLKSDRGQNLTVELAAVIYADSEEPGETAVWQAKPQFTSEIDPLLQAVDAVKSKDGKPFFQEQVDRGLFQALNGFDWKSDDDTARWVILMADAPPYAEGSNERAHTTDELVQIASKKQIQVFTMLTPAGSLTDPAKNEEYRECAVECQPYSRKFLQVLAEKTGGKFLDFEENRDVQTFLGSQLPSAQPVAMEPITDQERQALLAGTDRPIATGRMTMVVLPHGKLNAGAFDVPQPDETLVCTAMNRKLSALSGVKVFSVADVEAVLTAMNEPEPNLQNVCEAFKTRGMPADFIVWGQQTERDGKVLLHTSLYRGTDGMPLCEADEWAGMADEKHRSSLPERALWKLTTNAAKLLPEHGVPQARVAVFAAASSEANEAEAMESMSEDLEAKRALLAGMERLERVLAHDLSTGPAEVTRPLLMQAIRHFERADQIEPNNPWTSLMLANCYFNLSSWTPVDEQITAQKYLQKAYSNRDRVPAGADSLRKEIEALYQLVAEKDIRAAVVIYEELCGAQQSQQAHVAKRAHWMLSGIYSGDWGASEQAPELVRADAAREHILHLMTFWPDSPEAKFYENCRGSSGDPPVMIPREQIASTATPVY